MSAVGLYDDARFPGRCLVVLNEHCEDLTNLERDILHRLIDDARDVGAALRRTFRAERVNYAVLGNTHPHVHFHVIPRYAEREPLPGRTPWETPLAWQPLPEHERSEAVRRIGDALATLRFE